MSDYFSSIFALENDQILLQPGVSGNQVLLETIGCTSDKDLKKIIGLDQYKSPGTDEHSSMVVEKVWSKEYLTLDNIFNTYLEIGTVPAE